MRAGLGATTELGVLERSNLNGAASYAASVAAVAAAFLLRLFAGSVLGEHASFLFFVLPVVFAVLYLGRGPAIVAGSLSLIAGFTFISVEHRLAEWAVIEGLIFLLVCVAIGWLDARLSQQREITHKTARQLELLLEGATEYAILMIDPEGKISTWNSGAERILGRKAEDALGQHFSILKAGDDRHAVAMAELNKAKEEGRFTAETWQRRADGSEFLSDVSITPILDEAGHHQGYVKVIHDVTNQRAQRRALERRELQLRSILATVPDGMIVIDEKGIVQSFSPTAERLFGHSQGAVIGNNVNMLMPTPDHERHDGYLEHYLETGVPRIIGIGRIVSGLRADGSTFPMKLSVGEVHTEEGRLFTGFVQDLTERREFESKLEALESELIHVSRLSAMGTMASTLAHELNQPLTAIASYGEAAASILEGPDDPEKEMLREVVQEMAGQSLRAGGIVRRLREFVSRGDLAKSVEELPKVIDEAAALALVGTREKGVTTHFTYAPEASRVLIDRVQVQQVLINLMRNAVEAMENAPVRELTVTTSLASETMVQVSIRDTGSGIADGIKDKLFQAFNSSKEAGMGLGLSICRTIVEAHGGQIRAVDAEGGGTEFQFTLMRAPEQEEERE